MSEANEEPSSDDLRRRDSLLGAAFPATHWSLVMQAQHDDAKAAAALNELCRRYWYPIYAFVRCRGYARADAQDITQGFFLKAVTSGLIKSADHARGRLRSFLLGSLNRHLADYHRRESAEKRGGRAVVLPMECLEAEEKFAHDLSDGRSPDELYLTAWARSMLDHVRERLRQHYEKSGRGELHTALESFLSADETTTPYRELSAKVGASEASLRIQVFRMRQRFGKMLREEVALTVETKDELEEELVWLGRVLRSA